LRATLVSDGLENQTIRELCSGETSGDADTRELLKPSDIALPSALRTTRLCLLGGESAVISGLVVLAAFASSSTTFRNFFAAIFSQLSVAADDPFRSSAISSDL